MRQSLIPSRGQISHLPYAFVTLSPSASLRINSAKGLILGRDSSPSAQNDSFYSRVSEYILI